MSSRCLAGEPLSLIPEPICISAGVSQVCTGYYIDPARPLKLTRLRWRTAKPGLQLHRFTVGRFDMGASDTMCIELSECGVWRFPPVTVLAADRVGAVIYNWSAANVLLLELSAWGVPT